MIIHYDLFAGIGGFSLALDNAFKNYEIKHIFAEWEEFPTQVLKKHWPEGIYYGDIADLIADTSCKQDRWVQRPEFQPNTGTSLTIVTGGFPCQPFSQAGRRKGTADDRYKWPEMLRVIQNVQPDWVIAENVRGLVTWNKGLVLETVCTDLENEGYEVQPFIIPACAVGAPHRRDRVWIIANRNHTRSGQDNNAKNSISKRSGGRGKDGAEILECKSPEAENKRPSREIWDRDWREVAIATCNDSVDDGLPRDVGGLSCSRAKWRREALKAYGNAIVPQVAEIILQAIKETL